MQLNVSLWVNILAAALTPTIALLGIYIAWQQMQITKTKFNYELFDKRYKIFEATKNFINLIQNNGSIDDRKIEIFMLKTSDSEFLFDKSVNNYLAELRIKAATMSSAQTTLKTAPEGVDRGRAPQVWRDLITEFMDQLTVMKEKFRPFLAIQDNNNRIRKNYIYSKIFLLYLAILFFIVLNNVHLDK